VSVTPNGSGGYTWTYDFKLIEGQTAVPGVPPAVALVPDIDLVTSSFTTIFDFAGYIPGSCTWPGVYGVACTAQTPGYTPQGAVSGIFDNPSIVNITWAYTAGPNLVGPQDLGQFSVDSIYGEKTYVSYASRGTTTAGGFTVTNNGKVAGPIPEPFTLVTTGLALVGVAFLRRRRRI